MSATAYIAGAVHDGVALRRGVALVVQGPQVVMLAEPGDLPEGCAMVETGAEILAPGYVDLQVNGGGGVMLNDGPTAARLETMARAHAACGTTSILPTLITATPKMTEAALALAGSTVRGVIGLHLEGPHLDPVRAGAHSPALIREMGEDDLQRLLAAPGRLKVTLAPASVSPAQVARLVADGVLVSLGHSDCSYEEARRYVEAGATCVTHLFNAMSQMGSRAPGLVGAALAEGRLSAGVICDGIHVHAETLRRARAAKQAAGRWPGFRRARWHGGAMACSWVNVQRASFMRHCPPRWVSRWCDGLASARGSERAAYCTPPLCAVTATEIWFQPAVRSGQVVDCGQGGPLVVEPVGWQGRVGRGN
ncbi:N-acetylglucosamine-6-phosphate deacetylase [Oceanicola sp. 502str15]|uniref:N-acetylglucosamine-6-phosphate deacetylase n=1 Tax=Oceanicola sp. 502str15 TaxID=2696061 RepID=UPI0020956062|nr:amidohydrolase family protein [Oceanicola sp. 502str15]MCO6384065.1 amidohydrolase family protein [Oceanicola sp. 502str15]